MRTLTIPESIELTSYVPVLKIDHYYALNYYINIFSLERVKHPAVKVLFQRLGQELSKQIDEMKKYVEYEQNVNINWFKRVLSGGSTSKKILLVKSQYPLVSSLRSGEEERVINGEESDVILINIDLIDETGFAVVPSNINIFLGAILYSIVLLFGGRVIKRQTRDELILLGQLLYSIFLSLFGRKTGLITASDEQKEFLYYLIVCYLVGKYGNKQIRNVRIYDFIKRCESEIRGEYGNNFLMKISKVVLNLENWDVFSDIEDILLYAKQMNIFELKVSDMSLTWLKIFGPHGIMIFKNYIRLVAFFIASIYPSSLFKVSPKMYSKEGYNILIEKWLNNLLSS